MWTWWNASLCTFSLPLCLYKIIYHRRWSGKPSTDMKKMSYLLDTSDTNPIKLPQLSVWFYNSLWLWGILPSNFYNLFLPSFPLSVWYSRTASGQILLHQNVCFHRSLWKRHQNYKTSSSGTWLPRTSLQCTQTKALNAMLGQCFSQR